MRRALFLVLVSSCTLEPIDLEDKRCPCTDGFVCNVASDRCCTPAVSVEDFHGAWSTPGAILWQWTPIERDRARLDSYELRLADTVEGLDAAAMIFGDTTNPELRGFVREGTGGAEDVVVSTMTPGLAPNHRYFARLTAFGANGCHFVSEAVSFTTSAEAATGNEVVLFETGGEPFEPAPGGMFVRAGDAGDQRLEYRVPACGNARCSENLKLNGSVVLSTGGGPAPGITEGGLATTAYLELSLEVSKGPHSFFSRVWLQFESGAIYQLEPFTLLTDGMPHVYQVPLRVLRSAERALAHSDLTTPMTQFNVGGQWPAGGLVVVDDVRIRW
jgi:hypothetical protein